MSARFTEEAAADVIEIRSWYQAQASGLDEEFLRSLSACTSSLERFPEAFPILRRRVRQTHLRRFPYSLLYLVEAADIVVIAVYHSARNPRQFRQRIR